MKEDILEQLVDDYLQERGYFTRHNIKFLPRKDHPELNTKTDSNHSDIDVIGYNPLKVGPDRVWAVSCKSWQSGLRIESKLREIQEKKIVSGREAWKGFRELVEPKWSEAFKKSIKDLTGSDSFTYVTAVTFAKGKKQDWETYPRFLKSLAGNPIKVLELHEMLVEIEKSTTKTMASSNIGRVLQLIKASEKGRSQLIREIEKDDSTAE